ncbi:hypothetical protein N7532_009690 [Penicillium argentinense]|uniref:Uncharacterized protein n=1 Tax=Penicillium argentinense TaxID=1131581 RepID=A0A9W9K375_9EURO|nr:uncharacterized protein N7532_009690 [Penicillium argentinense]KAJ5091006.1 hypothetical protein N7532_009690 [Penicillium argentinense]
MSANLLRDYLQEIAWEQGSSPHESDKEFQELVNMNSDELRGWLEEGESADVQVGRKLVEVLEHHPEGQSSHYTDAEIPHVRRVISYCKRHLAQEESAKRNPHSRSYRSLKNWGHYALKEFP